MAREKSLASPRDFWTCSFPITSDNGTFRPRKELEEIYFNEVGLRGDDEVITYCRIGERSSHSWFALTFLLGMDKVRNYDGSWTEWGNAVRAPIAVGN
jgi:thiosulfate/3-mercaptopyruvate sulfurtransferase